MFEVQNQGTPTYDLVFFCLCVDRLGLQLTTAYMPVTVAYSTLFAISAAAIAASTTAGDTVSSINVPSSALSSSNVTTTAKSSSNAIWQNRSMLPSVTRGHTDSNWHCCTIFDCETACELLSTVLKVPLVGIIFWARY